MLEILAQLPHEDVYQRLVLIIALVRAPGALPAEAAEAHASAFVQGWGNDSASRAPRFVLARWILRYWRREALEHSFRLSAPGVLRDALAVVPPESTSLIIAARVLLAAEVATRAHYGADRTLLLKVAGREELAAPDAGAAGAMPQPRAPQ